MRGGGAGHGGARGRRGGKRLRLRRRRRGAKAGGAGAVGRGAGGGGGRLGARSWRLRRAAPARWEARDLERGASPYFFFFPLFYAGEVVGLGLVLVDTRSSLIAKRDRDSASAAAARHGDGRKPRRGATTRRRSRSGGFTQTVGSGSGDGDGRLSSAMTTLITRLAWSVLELGLGPYCSVTAGTGTPGSSKGPDSPTHERGEKVQTRRME